MKRQRGDASIYPVGLSLGDSSSSNKRSKTTRTSISVQEMEDLFNFDHVVKSIPGSATSGRLYSRPLVSSPPAKPCHFAFLDLDSFDVPKVDLEQDLRMIDHLILHT